jgi:S1-C subfamily serine protease
VNLVGRDEGSDRCVLEPTSADLEPLTSVRTYATLRMGERIFSVTAPSGLRREIDEGRVIGLPRGGRIGKIETSMDRAEGATGAAVVDEAGRLVGIITQNAEGEEQRDVAIAADSFWR